MTPTKKQMMKKSLARFCISSLCLACWWFFGLWVLSAASAVSAVSATPGASAMSAVSESPLPVMIADEDGAAESWNHEITKTRKLLRGVRGNGNHNGEIIANVNNGNNFEIENSKRSEFMSDQTSMAIDGNRHDFSISSLRQPPNQFHERQTQQSSSTAICIGNTLHPDESLSPNQYLCYGPLRFGISPHGHLILGLAPDDTAVQPTQIAWRATPTNLFLGILAPFVKFASLTLSSDGNLLGLDENGILVYDSNFDFFNRLEGKENDSVLLFSNDCLDYVEGVSGGTGQSCVKLTTPAMPGMPWGMVTWSVSLNLNDLQNMDDLDVDGAEEADTQSPTSDPTSDPTSTPTMNPAPVVPNVTSSPTASPTSSPTRLPTTSPAAPIPAASTPSTTSMGVSSIIWGYVWLDANSNGIRDNNEESLRDFQINLYDCTNSNGADDNLVDTSYTNAEGMYFFQVSSGRSYTAHFVADTSIYGYSTTGDSNVDFNGWTECVPSTNLAPIEWNAGILFVASADDADGADDAESADPISEGGDENNDGSFPWAPPLGGIQMGPGLEDEEVQTTTTSSTSFTSTTSTLAAASDAGNSPAPAEIYLDPSQEESAETVESAIESDPAQYASIGGSIYFDANNNGVIESKEVQSVIDGVTVPDALVLITVINCNHDNINIQINPNLANNPNVIPREVDSMEVAFPGKFFFFEFGPGTYRVQFQLQFTTPNNQNLALEDQYAFIDDEGNRKSTYETSCFPLAAGEIYDAADAKVAPAILSFSTKTSEDAGFSPNAISSDNGEDGLAAESSSDGSNSKNEVVGLRASSNENALSSQDGDSNSTLNPGIISGIAVAALLVLVAGLFVVKRRRSAGGVRNILPLSKSKSAEEEDDDEDGEASVRNSVKGDLSAEFAPPLDVLQVHPDQQPQQLPQPLMQENEELEEESESEDDDSDSESDDDDSQSDSEDDEEMARHPHNEVMNYDESSLNQEDTSPHRSYADSKWQHYEDGEDGMQGASAASAASSELHELHEYPTQEHDPTDGETSQASESRRYEEWSLNGSYSNFSNDARPINPNNPTNDGDDDDDDEQGEGYEEEWSLNEQDQHYNQDGNPTTGEGRRFEEEWSMNEQDQRYSNRDGIHTRSEGGAELEQQEYEGQEYEGQEYVGQEYEEHDQKKDRDYSSDEEESQSSGEEDEPVSSNRDHHHPSGSSNNANYQQYDDSTPSHEQDHEEYHDQYDEYYEPGSNYKNQPQYPSLYTEPQDFDSSVGDLSHSHNDAASSDGTNNHQVSNFAESKGGTAMPNMPNDDDYYDPHSSYYPPHHAADGSHHSHQQHQQSYEYQDQEYGEYQYEEASVSSARSADPPAASYHSLSNNYNGGWDNRREGGASASGNEYSREWDNAQGSMGQHQHHQYGGEQGWATEEDYRNDEHESHDHYQYEDEHHAWSAEDQQGQHVHQTSGQTNEYQGENKWVVNHDDDDYDNEAPYESDDSSESSETTGLSGWSSSSTNSSYTGSSSNLSTPSVTKDWRQHLSSSNPDHSIPEDSAVDYHSQDWNDRNDNGRSSSVQGQNNATTDDSKSVLSTGSDQSSDPPGASYKMLHGFPPPPPRRER